MQKIKKIILLLIIISLFTGCTDKEKTEDTPLPQPEQQQDQEQVEDVKPTKGGELIISIRKPKTLNPLLNEEHSIDQMLKLVYDTLIIYDEQEKPAPNLAQSWEQSADGTVMTITLRSDILWHDGTPFTSQDVIFSLDTIKKSQPTAIYKKCIENISYYKAMDEHTVRIVYNQPFSAASYALYFPIIPAHYYEEDNVLDTPKNMEPLGTGAYQFAEFTPMKELELTTNSKWFKGEPYIEKIKALVVPDKETDLAAFDQNQIDLISTDVIDWGKYSQMDETKLYEYSTSYYDFIGFNFDNPMVQDKRIRQAIVYGIDRNQLLETVYLGHGIITDTPLSPDSWLQDDSGKQYTYDINTAKELLTEAGWTDNDGDGVLEKTIDNDIQKFSIPLMVNNDNKLRLNVAYSIKEMLKQIGIDLEINEVSPEEYISSLTQRKYVVFIGGWKFSPILDYTFAFHSSQIPPTAENGKNYIGYSNIEMDNLLKQAFMASGDANIKNAYTNLQQLILEELPYVSLYFRTSALITNDRVRGEIKPTQYSIFNNIQDWYIYEGSTKE